jgi:hypothetical protein
MKVPPLLILAILTGALRPAQNGPIIGDFTKSPTEHLVIQIDQRFVVRSLKGVITHKEGYREPLAGVLFEIQGSGPDKKIRHVVTNEHGEFRIRNVPFGIYEFKTTLDGFNSIMGTISVSKHAPKSNNIKIELTVGA